MTTKEAVQFVMKEHNLTMYGLSMKIDSTHGSVRQWLKKTRMSPYYVKVFKNLFNVEVDDLC